MKGTEKQIKWAEDIERKAMEYVTNKLKFEKENKIYTSPRCTDVDLSIKAWERLKETLEMIFASENMQSASFVIDKRFSLDESALENAHYLAYKEPVK